MVVSGESIKSVMVFVFLIAMLMIGCVDDQTTSVFGEGPDSGLSPQGDDDGSGQSEWPVAGDDDTVETTDEPIVGDEDTLDDVDSTDDVDATEEDMSQEEEADLTEDEQAVEEEDDAAETVEEDEPAEQEQDVTRFHADGWVSPSEHGMALKMGDLDCRMCHGQTLTGGTSGVGCDACHPAGWRQDCTFCHGGTDNNTGAPPVNLDNESEPDAQGVGAHTAHVETINHGAYDCSQCHIKPMDIFSEGHIFDDTPGLAEITLANGLSPEGTQRDGECSSLYCHGNGQAANGSASFSGSINTCDACHPYLNSGSSAWGTMSGDHSKHLREGIQCWECHNAVLDSNMNFANADLHVNGAKDVLMINSGTYAGGSCTVVCHGKWHFARGWR